MMPQVKDSTTEASTESCDLHMLDGATDAELIAIHLSTNSKFAVETLIRRHASMVRTVIRRIVSNPADAEDAFQVTFLVFIRSARKIRKHSSISAWLYGVAYRTACRIRSRGYQQRTSSLEETDCPPRDHRDLLTKFAQDSQLEFLDRELQVLSSSLREVIVDHHLLGHTASQIADRMDISVSAVEGRLRRGRAALRQALARRGVSFSVAAAISATQFQDAHAALTSSAMDSFVQTDWLSSLFEHTTNASLSTTRQFLVTKELSMPTSMISKATLAATLAACSVAAIAVPSMFYGSNGSAQSTLLMSTASATQGDASDFSDELPADDLSSDLGVPGVLLVNAQGGAGGAAQTGGGGGLSSTGAVGGSTGAGGLSGGAPANFGAGGGAVAGSAGASGDAYGSGFDGAEGSSGAPAGAGGAGPFSGGPATGGYGGGPGGSIGGGAPGGAPGSGTAPGSMGGGGYGGFNGAGMGGMGGGAAPDRPNRTFVMPGKTKPNWLTRGGTLAEEKAEGREQTRLKIREKVTIDFNQLPLSSVLSHLSDETNVKILLDEVAMEAGVATPSDPVSLSLASVSLQRVLEIILDPMELTYVVEPEGLHITTKDAGAAKQRRFYDLAYIATDEERAAAVHDLIVELISSDDEPIHRLGSMLIVDGVEQTHQQIEEVLSQLAQMPPDNLQGVDKPAPAATGGMF